jgi:hypothetical protein
MPILPRDPALKCSKFLRPYWGLFIFPLLHGLPCGLHSIAASRLHSGRHYAVAGRLDRHGQRGD